jgi:basic amino acid/polyamine antiporter, APA family
MPRTIWAACATGLLLAALLPQQPQVLAVAAVVALCAVNLLGVKKTAAASAVFAGVTLVVLATVVAAGVAAPETGGGGLDATDPWGVLTAAGLIFFAFAGYARIATLGEEVKRPEWTIPRAVPIALGITVAVYAAIAVVALDTLGSAALAASVTPLGDVVGAAAPALVPVVSAGAAVAVAGVLLSLLAGVGRTTLAMARDRRLPSGLAAVSERHGVPWAAEVAASVLVVVIVLTVDLTGAIGFSSFCVLVYYAVANASASTLDFKRPPSGSGLAGGLPGAASLPTRWVVGGRVFFACGAVCNAPTRRAARREDA